MGVSIDCSQPSIFSYFYSIVERAERIARELDASAKRETWQGRGVGIEPACFALASLKSRESVNSAVYEYNDQVLVNVSWSVFFLATSTWLYIYL